MEKENIDPEFKKKLDQMVFNFEVSLAKLVSDLKDDPKELKMKNDQSNLEVITWE